MEEFGWIPELDTFEDKTPFGKIQFSNIIATLPCGKNFRQSERTAYKFHTANRVIFACHYDSKLFKEFEFIGAIDSAVPCAMLLELAKFIKDNLTQKQLELVS